jgi:excisionase family DNA binding protein
MKTTTAPSTTEATQLKPVRWAAETLCISRATVYALMERGDLAYVKIGRSRRVKESDVLDLIDRSTIERA